MTHSFTLPSLGKAPFKVVDRKGYGPIYCECCGTSILKHYCIIESSDNVISVVSLACLKKTGDLDLIAGAKHLTKEKI